MTGRARLILPWNMFQRGCVCLFSLDKRYWSSWREICGECYGEVRCGVCRGRTRWWRWEINRGDQTEELVAVASQAMFHANQGALVT